METFASVEDLELRWKSLDESDKERAEALLLDASAYLLSQLNRSGIEVDGEDEIQSHNLKTVVCAMVKRIMAISDKLFGVSQFSQTAGSFTEMGTAANPNGDMYLTNAEKVLLGISGKKQTAKFVRIAIHNPDGSEIDAW